MIEQLLRFEELVEESDDVDSEKQQRDDEEQTLHAAFVSLDGLDMGVCAVELHSDFVLLGESILRSRAPG